MKARKKMKARKAPKKWRHVLSKGTKARKARRHLI